MPSDIRNQNAQYLGLPLDLMSQWETLNQQRPYQYTPELNNFCKAVSKRIGWCGDIWAKTLAEWIKHNVGLSHEDKWWANFCREYFND